MPGWPQRWWTGRRLELLYVGAPPLVLLAIGLTDTWTGVFSDPIGTAPATSAVLPGTVACLALLLRRSRPLITLAIVLAAILVPPVLLPVSVTYWDEFMAWVVALYSCGRHAEAPAAWAGLGASMLALGALVTEFPVLLDLGGVLFNGALLGAAFATGLLARGRARSRARLVQEAAERAVAEERAGRRERQRIARELHDVVSHTITVIVLQAGGARFASGADPGAAVRALAQIEELGRSSLAELRSLLPLLHDDSGEMPVLPQPGLAEVEELCERMRRLGLPVQLTLDRVDDDVPTSVQLTAYRTVQEGLTNVVRHAGMVDTKVRVGRSGSPASLVVDLLNRDGTRVGPPGAAVRGSGHGLAGLERRVLLAGGTFRAAPGPDGFVLHVELPLGTAA